MTEQTRKLSLSKIENVESPQINKIQLPENVISDNGETNECSSGMSQNDLAASPAGNESSSSVDTVSQLSSDEEQ